MNSDASDKAVFQIELKLRYLVKEADSLVKVFAIYDCCRVEVTHIKGLFGKRGVGRDMSDEEVSEENEECKYFHIQACAPGGLAEADGGFAQKILDKAIKFSKRDPMDFISCP